MQISNATFMQNQIGVDIEAMHFLRLFEDMEERTNTKAWINQDLESVRGLIIRDSGNPKTALTLFKNLVTEEDDAANAGNMARCYQKLKEFEEAEKLLRTSLDLLRRDDRYRSLTNMGYAYHWIAEFYFEKGDLYKAKAFTLLAKNSWSEYAPGLLWRLKDLEFNLLNSGSPELDIHEAKDIEMKFLSCD